MVAGFDVRCPGMDLDGQFFCGPVAGRIEEGVEQQAAGAGDPGSVGAEERQDLHRPSRPSGSGRHSWSRRSW